MALIDRAPTVDAPANVLGMLREQNELFARLETFATNQRRWTAAGDLSRLMGILADRQRLTARLTELAMSLKPVRQDWSRVRDRLTVHDRQEAEQLLQDSETRLRRVIEADEQDARLLSARRAVVSGAMRESHSAGQAVAAYRATPQVSGAGRRLDESQ